MQKIPMTVTGAKKLKAELEHLERVERPAVIAAITEAREHGDLRENAEYHAAKEKQGFVEARIRDIQHKLSRLQVVDITQVPNTGVVVFGATVTLYNMRTGQEVRYTIVGEEEADVKSQKISVSSPVVRAIIRRKVGEQVAVQAPSGLLEFEIVSVVHA